jgi:hypothetical protein
VAQGQVYPRVLRFSSVSIITSLLHTRVLSGGWAVDPLSLRFYTGNWKIADFELDVVGAPPYLICFLIVS